MNVLLVYARFPTTYWGFQYAMQLAGKGATLPPLGLVSLAALLPPDWTPRIVDLNVEPLSDEHLQWADTVFVSGMHIQADSMHAVLARAKAAGLRTAVGGPSATSCQDDPYKDADVVFQGEVEGRIEELVVAVNGTDRVILPDPGKGYPALDTATVPRYDLINLDHYTSASLQYSRGCPFQCEFCDIIEMFGRKTRTKSATQVFAELQSLYDLGYRGSLFFVDDNFIGNKKEVRALLPELEKWQAQRDFPFELYTEASLNLAQDQPLLDAMVSAGFSSVFLGIETPSKEALRGTKKLQNLKLDLSEAVTQITRCGLEVMGGFIVGFDEDTEDVFDLQRAFILHAPIPLAMVGMLTALPSTALWRRLESEGRLRGTVSGDSFARPNFVPRLDEEVLLRGYRDLLQDVYAPAAYYERCAQVVRLAPRPRFRRKARWADVATLLRTVVRVGLFSGRRWLYWRLLVSTLARSPHAFPNSIAQVVRGEHLIRYTQDVILPLLRRSLAELQHERRLGTERPSPAPVAQSRQLISSESLVR